MRINYTELPESGVVDRAGAYRLLMRQYHSQDICPGPSVSSSGLREAEIKSPWDFYQFWAHNPDAYKREDTDPMRFGRAAHALLLEDEVFEDGYAVSPYDSFKSREARMWRSDMIALGKTVLTENELIAIGNMAKNLREMQLIDLLMEGDREVSHIWQDEVTGLWIKSRMDQMAIGGEIVDIKITHDCSRHAIQRTIRQYGLDMQCALSYEAREIIHGDTPPGAILIFIEAKPPHKVAPCPISPDAIYLARCRNRRSMDAIARGLETGDWPYPEREIDNFQYEIPPWEKEKLEQEQRDGTLPHLPGQP